MTTRTATISVTIDRAADDVYEFVRDAATFPRYATLFKTVRPDAENEWTAETDQGPMKLRFAPRNIFRVLDHHVQLRPDLEVYNPMRVLANGDGAEVVFTLFRRPDMSDADFEDDRRAVESDLRRLKDLLERGEGLG